MTCVQDIKGPVSRIYRKLYPGYKRTCVQDIKEPVSRIYRKLYPGYERTCVQDIKGPILRIITVYLVREISTPVL